MKTVNSGRGRSSTTGLRRLFGLDRFNRAVRGSGSQAIRWVALLTFAYVFFFPVLFMFATSIKSTSELTNPSIHWITRSPSTAGYVLAFDVLGSE